MIAAAKGNSQLVEYLSERKDVNVNSKNIAGQTPLILAVLTPLEFTDAVHLDKMLSVVRFLLHHPDVNVNARENRDRTVLSLAAEVGHMTVLNEFLKSDRVDLGLSDIMGKFPSEYAEEHGHNDVLDKLRKPEMKCRSVRR